MQQQKQQLSERGSLLGYAQINTGTLQVFKQPHAFTNEVPKVIADAPKFAQNGQGINSQLAQAAGKSDPRLERIQLGISTLESNAGAIAAKSPQYGAGAADAAQALRAVSIKAGPARMFTGRDNPMRPSKDYKTLFYNPLSPIESFTVPRIAHEGQHFVDHGAGTLYSRERRAYNLEYATGLGVGPYHARLSDADVTRLTDDIK